MLLKAVLIVCVVRKERKANCCESAREFYFFARRGAQATESREEGPTQRCSESAQHSRD
jgi:hypothetical protein